MPDLQKHLALAVEILCFLTIFDTLFLYRYKRRFLMFLTIPAGLLLLLLLKPVLQSHYFFPLLSLLLYLAAGNILFRGSILKKAVCSIAICCVSLGLDLLTNGIFVQMKSVDDDGYAVFLVVLSKGLLYLLSQFFYYLYRKGRGEPPPNNQSLLSIIPLTLLALSFACVWAVAVENKITHWTVAALILLVLFSVVLFLMLDRLFKHSRTQSQNQILEQQIALERKNMVNLAETHLQIRQLSHDFRNHLAYVGDLLKNGEYKKAEDYISEIAATSSNVLLPISTKNMAIDAVLNQKYQLASSKNIRLQFQLSEMTNLRMNDMDLVTILSNVLDNAIEATEKTEKTKPIQVKLIQEENELLISVKNPVTHKVVFSDGEIKSSKENSAYHGLGIKNVRQVLRKYRSDFYLDCNENEFVFLTIVQFFPNSNP